MTKKIQYAAVALILTAIFCGMSAVAESELSFGLSIIILVGLFLVGLLTTKWANRIG